MSFLWSSSQSPDAKQHKNIEGKKIKHILGSCTGQFIYQLSQAKAIDKSFQEFKCLPESAGNLKSSVAALKQKVVLSLPVLICCMEQQLSKKRTTNKEIYAWGRFWFFRKYSLPSLWEDYSSLPISKWCARPPSHCYWWLCDNKIAKVGYMYTHIWTEAPRTANSSVSDLLPWEGHKPGKRYSLNMFLKWRHTEKEQSCHWLIVSKSRGPEINFVVGVTEILRLLPQHNLTGSCHYTYTSDLKGRRTEPLNCRIKSKLNSHVILYSNF